jgi:hypothetical protein
MFHYHLFPERDVVRMEQIVPHKGMIFMDAQFIEPGQSESL